MNLKQLVIPGRDRATHLTAARNKTIRQIVEIMDREASDEFQGGRKRSPLYYHVQRDRDDPRVFRVKVTEPEITMTGRRETRSWRHLVRVA